MRIVFLVLAAGCGSRSVAPATPLSRPRRAARIAMGGESPEQPRLTAPEPTAPELPPLPPPEPPPQLEPEPPPPPPLPICLALSVGELKGIAHLGAIQALRELHVPVECVVGNSMGSLVGSLYASDPETDTTERFRSLAAAYATASRDAAPSGFSLLLELWSPRFHRMSLARMTRVLDGFLQHRTIESLPVKFATAGQRTANREVVYTTRGNVARAVSNSIANPLVFEDVTLSRRMVDPGMDQLSATPISAACRLFPAHRILAVNVTSRPPVREQGTECPVLEVAAYPGNVGEEVMSDAAVFQRVVATGYEATRRAVEGTDWIPASDPIVAE